MARYTGPKHKLARREGINILDKESQSLIRRLNIPPGVHGKKRKRALSEFGQQLREKQKAKAMYGILERQFKNMVDRLQKRKGEKCLDIHGFLVHTFNLLHNSRFCKVSFRQGLNVTR